MKLTNEQKDILRILVINELRYYETNFDNDYRILEFIEKLKNILRELETDK